MNINFINENMFTVKNISGIYCIKNVITNSVYIGESTNIKKRAKQHYNMLKNNNHYNQSLQNDYNQYGEDNFEFIILQPHLSYNSLRTKAELLIIESKYIKEYSKTHNVYNIENTIKDFLIGKRSISIGDQYSSAAIRENIVRILLRYNVVYIDDMVYIIRIATNYDFTTSRNKSTIKYQRIVDKLITKDSIKYFSKRTIEYLSSKNIIEKRSSYMINNLEEYYKWLKDNGLENFIDIIQENLKKEIMV